MTKKRCKKVTQFSKILRFIHSYQIIKNKKAPQINRFHIKANEIVQFDCISTERSLLQLQAEKDAIKDDLTTETTFVIQVFII